jgi:hypothetical protein
MAYSFDLVMGQLGKKPNDKADIFGNKGGGNTGAPGLGGGGAEGDLSGSGGGVANAKTNSTADQSDVSSSAAYRSNVGKQNSPVNFGSMQSGVAAKGKALDDEANSYLQTWNDIQPNKLSESDADQLHGAIDKSHKAKPSGDGPMPYGGGSGPRDSLGYWSSLSQNAVENVDPFKSTLNIQDSTFDNLGTDAGVQNLLRKSAGAEYNAGDASFDQALLSQDQGFQQGRQGLMEGYKGLQDRQNAMGGEVTKKAQLGLDSAKASYLEDMRTRLRGMQGGFESDAMAREKQIEDAAAAQQSALLGQSGDVLSGRAKDLATQPSEMAQYFNTDGIDAGQFAKGNFDAGAQDWKSFLDDDQALKFNNIFSLLGQPDIYGKGNRAGGYADSDLVSYDTAGMDQALQTGAKGRYDTAQAEAEAKRVADEQAAADQKAKDEAAAASAAAEAAATQAAIDKAAEDAKYKPGKDVKDDLREIQTPEGPVGAGTKTIIDYLGGGKKAQEKGAAVATSGPSQPVMRNPDPMIPKSLKGLIPTMDDAKAPLKLFKKMKFY